MENELIEYKTWWQRYRIWVIMTIILAVATVMFLMNDGNGIASISKAATDLPLFENAAEQARNNKDVVNVLGNIKTVDKMAIAEGDVNYVGDSVSATITVKGAKGKAKMDLAAFKENGSWKYQLIKVRIKQPKQEIIVFAE